MRLYIFYLKWWQNLCPIPYDVKQHLKVGPHSVKYPSQNANQGQPKIKEVWETSNDVTGEQKGCQ
jgi:hypothetical protein